MAAACMATFALWALYRQWQASRVRNAWLRRFWRTGLAALLAASLLVAADGPALVSGVLVIGIGLPLLVIGMQLEIVAFLGWIELHRRSGRGVHLPGVHRLLPDADKGRVLAIHAAASALLLLAVLWPEPALARLAGAVLACAYGVLWWLLHGVARRSGRFVSSRQVIA